MLKNNYITKRLDYTHREKVLAHFNRLDSESLYNRFCYSIRPELLEKYVSKINFDKNGVFGVFDDELNIVGVGECVLEGNTHKAEVGFSVEVSHQGQGLGGKLLQRIVRFAKAREKTHLEMLCLSTNRKSMYLAKKFGLKIQNTSGESLGIIDIAGSKPEMEDFKEKIEDAMAYYALRHKEQLYGWSQIRQSMMNFFKICV